MKELTEFMALAVRYAQISAENERTHGSGDPRFESAQVLRSALQAQRVPSEQARKSK